MDPLQHPNVKRFKKGKKHFYAILDETMDKALITSKAYGTQKSRDNGVLTLLKNLDRIENITEKGQYSFFFKAGNNQSLAYSAAFSSAEKRQQAVAYLRQLFKSEKKDSAAGTKAKREPSKARSKQPEKKPSTVTASKSLDLPPKYSFRLEFYFQSEKNRLRGRIVYPFKKEKKVFDGIDMSAIESFLKTYLPKEEELLPSPAPEQEATQRSQGLKKSAPQPEPEQEVVVPPIPKPSAAKPTESPRTAPEKPAATPSLLERAIADSKSIVFQPEHQSVPARIRKPEPVRTKTAASKAEVQVAAPEVQAPKTKEKTGMQITPASSTVDFRLVESHNRNEDLFNLEKKGQYEIRLNLSNLEFSRAAYPNLVVSIYGHSLETRKKLPVGHAQVKTAASNLVTVPLNLGTLPSSGSHKLELVAKLAAEATAVSPFYLVGSKMVEIH